MIKALIRKSLDKVLRLIPLGVYRRMVPRNPIGVFYHAVSTEPLPHIDHLYPPLTAAQFESALVYLKKHYTPVSYQRLHDHVFNDEPLPENALHLSFDDGYVENFTVVRPLLLKYEIPCTFFLTTDWLDNQSIFYRNKVSLVIETFDALNIDQQSSAIAAINQNEHLELTGVDIDEPIYLIIDPGVTVSTAQIFAAEELTRNWRNTSCICPQTRCSRWQTKASPWVRIPFRITSWWNWTTPG